jgi:deazaflavin-dependent oxidoreductase (nitroreductase family)
MDLQLEHALQHDRLVDITTIGRTSGRPHRLEIGFHYFDGAYYISGLPGPRDWYANLLAQPQFTVHVKQSAKADLPALATPITDEADRRPILEKVTARWGRQSQLDDFVARSPLVSVQF